MSSTPLLKVSNLTLCLEKKNILKNISFDLHENETLCIVGESGCGKSLTLRSILGVLPSPSLEMTGEIIFKDQNIRTLHPEKMRLVRKKEFGYVPQSPHANLNPMLSIETQMMQTFEGSNKQAYQIKKNIVEILKKVGFEDPELILYSRPHQLSGGMKQRVLIAMALMNFPAILLLDEPTTALDATLQKGVLQLLQSLKQEYALSIILVTHDLGVVEHSANRVAVMKDGQILEYGLVDTVFSQPSHSYTKDLLAACHL